MWKKLMVTTALTGLMIGTALAEGSPSPGSSNPNPPPPAAQSTPSAPAPSATEAKPSTPAPAPTASMGTTGSAKFVNSQKSDQFLASKFKGTDVVGSDDQKIGDVSDILFDKSGKIEAYVVSVGGFLGIGAKDVALEPSAFTVVSGDKSKNESDKLKVALSKDQLKQAANFEAYQAPRATTGAAAPGGGSPRPMSPPAGAR
jgi:sporulation protein YlmC with PRC-barrel domain